MQACFDTRIVDTKQLPPFEVHAMVLLGRRRWCTDY
jgi:hypothetical protein